MDTAQPLAAAETDPNVQLASAADAFKAFDNTVAAQPRDESGRFAREEQPEEIAKDEPDAELAEGEPEAQEDEPEAAEDAQPMPPSWPADQAEQWSQLPPETQAFLANREGERERAVQAKFQESANARKEADSVRAEASARRDELISAFETVEALYQTPEPDPRAFGYGTQQFNEAAFLAAHQQWKQTAGAIAQFKEQREALQKEQVEAQQAEAARWLTSHNEEYAPKFAELVPDIKDQTKAAAIFDSVFKYAMENGVDASMFSPENIKDIPLGHILAYWKAQQYDRLRQAEKAAPKPKPAGPAIKPGVSSPRSAQKAARRQQASERLSREGSIEAGAAMFKQIFR